MTLPLSLAARARRLLFAALGGLALSLPVAAPAQNLGAIIYASGTAAGAREGALLGAIGIAMSQGVNYEFGREVSYYHGRDSDGNWSEGSRRDRAVLPSVPAGQYFLRVLPEAQVPTDFLEYRIVVRRDVPILFPYLLGLVLLAVPPVFLGLRAWGMESARWKESDYAPADDDDDD